MLLRFKITLIIVLALGASLLLVFPSALQASPTCMRFIEISTVPRIAAIGQAGVGLTDATWAQVNPANLINVDGSLITFSHTSWFSDISLEALSVNTSSDKHGLGFSVVGLHTEPLEKYDAEDTYEGSFRFFDIAVAATYARRLAGGFAAGVTGKVLYEKIDWDAASGFAADIGLSYKAPQGFLWGDFGLGLLARNLGTRVGYHGEEFDLPSAVQAGISYEPSLLPPYVSLRLALDYQSTRAGEDGLLAGCEIGVARIVALRFGYRGAYEKEQTFGLGVSLASVSFDYAYMDLGSDLGRTHRLAVSFKTAPIFPLPAESK